MKCHRIVCSGTALALGLGLLVMLNMLLPARVEAGPVAGVGDDLSISELLPLAPEAADVIATNTLSIEPAFTVIGIGDVFTVNIVISDVQDLGSLEYTLEFSPSVVQAARVQLEDFPGSTGRTIVELPTTGDPISNSIGTVTHGFFSIGVPGSGPGGMGIIASVVFTAADSGDSPLDLTEAQATNTDGDVLTPTLMVDGRAMVRGAGVNVCCDSTQSGLPGTQVTHTFALTNTGNYTDSFTLEITGNAWNTDAPLSVSSLPPGESTTVDVTVDIPHPSFRLAAIVDSDTFTLTATSDYLNTTLDTVRGTTNAEVTPDVMLSGNTKNLGLPGTRVVHSFVVTNTGNYTDNFGIAVAYGSWMSTPSVTETGPLAAGASFDFQVMVDISVLELVLATDIFTVTVTSSWDVISDTAIGTTFAEVTPGVTLSGDTMAGDSAGSQVTHGFVVTNSGDYTDSFAIAVVNQTWASTLSITNTGDLMASTSLPFTVTVEIPSDATSADSDTFTVTATSERDGVTADTAIGTTRVVEMGVSIAPRAQMDGGLPGTNVVYTYTVTNDGDYTDTFSLSLTGALWPTDLSKHGTGDLDPGESFNVQATVHIPHLTGFVLGSDAFTLTATSGWDATVSDEASGTTDQVVQPGVMVADISVADMPGTTVTHTVTITNDGDYTDTFALTYGGNQWPTVGPAVVGPLGAGIPMTSQVTVDIPDFGVGEALISDTFVVTATSGFGVDVFDEATGTTQPVVTPGVSITPMTQTDSGLPGTSVVYTYTVTNDGDYTDSFILSVSGNTWTTDLSIPTTGDLAPGVSRTFQATVSIPASVSGGDSEVATTVATSGWNSAVAAAAQVTTTAEEVEGFKIHLPLVIRNG